MFSCSPWICAYAHIASSWSWMCKILGSIFSTKRTSSTVDVRALLPVTGNKILELGREENACEFASGRRLCCTYVSVTDRENIPTIIWLRQ